MRQFCHQCSLIPPKPLNRPALASFSHSRPFLYVQKPEALTVEFTPQHILMWLLSEWKSFSCVQLFVVSWTIQSMEFSSQNTGVGSLSLLQGIFPTQGSNQGLLLCRWILYQLSHKGSPCDSNQGVYCQSLNSGSSTEPRKTHVFVLCFWKLGNMEALWGWGNIHWVDCRHCSILKSSSDHEGEVSALVELMFSRWVQMGSLPCHQGALCPWISSLLHEVMVSSSPKKVRPLKDFVLNSNISLCSSFSLIQTARIWSLWKRPKLDKSKCVHVEGSYKVT